MTKGNIYHSRDLAPGAVYSVTGEGIKEDKMRFGGELGKDLIFIKEFDGTSLVSLICPASQVIITGDESTGDSIRLKGLLPSIKKAEMTVNFGNSWSETTITASDSRYEQIDKCFWGAH
ncbi:MAG: hypothetical protein AABW50_02380 [Nanoarchaeota archaeon]